jgi:hypothetical protein
MAGLVEQLDASIASLFSGWNTYSTIITLGIVSFLGWVVLDIQDADTHPLLLARQAVAAYVRHPGESAIFRSPETPHGCMLCFLRTAGTLVLTSYLDGLRTGLAVKPPGAPAYTAGRDGDLRDVWRRVTGEIPLEKDGGIGKAGKIQTVFGREELTEHNIADITREINIIGKHLKEHGAKRVAIYLPNSVEFLATVFGSFKAFVQCETGADSRTQLPPSMDSLRY